LQAVAKRHGWDVVTVYKDQGISGAKGRDKRPGLDRLMQAVARREIDMVAAWSVDRLGRSLTDLLAVLQDLHAKSVDLYLHQQGLDTSTPSGRAGIEEQLRLHEVRDVLRDRNDLKLLTGCADFIPNRFAHQKLCHW
jgi:DNA invertase Pin-like site-specific DNA recombinase